MLHCRSQTRASRNLASAAKSQKATLLARSSTRRCLTRERRISNFRRTFAADEVIAYPRRLCMCVCVHRTAYPRPSARFRRATGTLRFPGNVARICEIPHSEIKARHCPAEIRQLGGHRANPACHRDKCTVPLSSRRNASLLFAPLSFALLSPLLPSPIATARRFLNHNGRAP